MICLVNALTFPVCIGVGCGPCKNMEKKKLVFLQAMVFA